MKKLLAIAIVSLFSLNCMAGSHGRTISIKNNTKQEVEVTDSGRHGNETNNSVIVGPGRSASLKVRVHEPKGSFPIPSSVMPHVTTITVADDEGSNSIKIDENTKSITINEGLELEKD